MLTKPADLRWTVITNSTHDEPGCRRTALFLRWTTELECIS